MNTNTHILNYSEARDEAQRLTRVIGRRVEPVHVPCDCEYSKLCSRCAGEGAYHELRYASCDHVVQESDDFECDANNCESREREARDIERPDTWPRVGKPLRSCTQVQAERDAKEAA